MPPSTSTLPAGRTLSDLQAGFAARLQDLATIGSRVSLTDVVLPEDTAQYELELRNYHKIDAGDVAAYLGSDVVRGLTTADAFARLARAGPNVVTPPRDTPVWVKFLRSFVSGFAPVRAREECACSPTALG